MASLASGCAEALERTLLDEPFYDTLQKRLEVFDDGWWAAEGGMPGRSTADMLRAWEVRVSSCQAAVGFAPPAHQMPCGQVSPIQVLHVQAARAADAKAVLEARIAATAPAAPAGGEGVQGAAVVLDFASPVVAEVEAGWWAAGAEHAGPCRVADFRRGLLGEAAESGCVPR